MTEAMVMLFMLWTHLTINKKEDFQTFYDMIMILLNYRKEKKRKANMF